MRLILLIVLSTCFFSCNEEDETPPVINILNPSELLTTYQVPFTIDINVEARDETNLKSLSAQVKNANGTPISNESKATFENQTEGNLNAALTVDDKYVSSGECYIQVTAHDGENFKSSFYNFQLQELPKRFERIDVLASSSNTSRIDTGYLNQPFVQALTLPRTDFLAYDPNTERVLALGLPNAGARLYNRSWELISSSATPNGNEDVFFTCMQPEAVGGSYFAGTIEGNIQAFNTQGNLSTLFEGPSNSRAVALSTVGNKIVGAFKFNGQNQWQLRQFVRSSAAFVESLTLNFEPLQLIAETDNTLLIRGSEAEVGVLKRYFLAENAMQDIVETAALTGPAVLVENVLLFSEDNQMSFSQSFQGIFPIYSATDSRINVWENVEGILFFNDGNWLRGVSGNLPFLSNEAYSQNIGPEAQQVLLIYNK